MLASIMAALAALPEIVKAIESLIAEVKTLRQESIDKSLEQIRNDVNETIAKIQTAKTNEDRIALARDLNSRISK
jgi:hypothetical protein